jgi:uncharacterized membrane protein YgcG
LFISKFHKVVCSITILSFFASIYYYIQLQMASQIVIFIAFGKSNKNNTNDTSSDSDYSSGGGGFGGGSSGGGGASGRW